MIDTRKKRFSVLFFGALLTGLTLVFPKIGFIEWITLAPACMFLLDECERQTLRTRQLYGYGFFFFMCYYVVVFHWFINLYPLEFIDGMSPIAAGFIVFLGVFGISAFQALFGGLFFLVARFALNTRLLKERKILRPLLIAAMWSVYEWTQTIGWWGVPWGRLPIAQSEYIVGLQTASLLGSYFITFVIVLVNSCIAYAIIERKSIKLMGIVACATLVFQYGAGTVLYFADVDGEKTVNVAAVQGNVSTAEKWTVSSKENTLQRYRDYTLEAAEKGAEVVVWPETAFPYLAQENNSVGDYLCSLAVEAQVIILAGAFTGEADQKQYNSIIAVLPDGSFHETVYSKQRLVPFGEFVPFYNFISVVAPPLAELDMLGSDLAFGKKSEVIELDEMNVGPLICFDSIYEDLARASVRGGAQIITISTNDSWFTDSAALYMHRAQAQLRAIENGRYVIRSANTGISAVISSKGDVIDSLEPNVGGIVQYNVHINDRITPYTIVGNLMIYVFIAFFAGVFIYEIFIRIKGYKNSKEIKNGVI